MPTTTPAQPLSSEPSHAPPTPVTEPSSRAQQNVHSGFLRLVNLSNLIASSTTGRSLSRNTSPSPEATATPVLPIREIEAQATRDVENELNLYMAQPNVPRQIAACDVLSFWQVRQQYEAPIVLLTTNFF
jgi:hypothetical protein